MGPKSPREDTKGGSGLADPPLLLSCGMVYLLAEASVSVKYNHVPWGVACSRPIKAAWAKAGMLSAGLLHCAVSYYIVDIFYVQLL